MLSLVESQGGEGRCVWCQHDTRLFSLIMKIHTSRFNVEIHDSGWIV